MAPIDEAIDFAASQESPNYSEIARRFKVEWLTLWRRAKGICQSREQQHKNSGLLSPAQTDFLLDYIKRLSQQGLPPTPTMVRSFVIDITGKAPGVNWPAKFLKHHNDKI